MPGLPRKVKEAGDRAEAELQSLMQNPLESATPQGTPQPIQDFAPPPATPQQGTPQAGTVDWKDEAEKAIHKYNVLSGKYTAETQRLRDENRSLSERIEALERSSTPTTPADPAHAAAPTGELPDWIKDTYGDQLPAWVQEVAAAAAKSAVAPVQKKVESIDRNNRAQTEGAFYDAITGAHPDWQTINQLEAFQKFCSSFIPGTNVERQEVIERGQKQLDPAPIIAQFSEFKRLYGTGEQQRLKSQEVPVQGGGNPIPISSEVGSITETQIHQFYSDVAKGKYRSRPDEIKRLEGLIKAASQAGKIVRDLTPPNQQG